MEDTIAKVNIVELTAEVVAAYVEHNNLVPAELPSLIASVHAALTGLGTSAVELQAEQKAPAVSIKKSISHDFLICLEDGRKFKSLKRHLRTSYNLSPDDYRAKWGLPSDYPMVAPAYAAARSNLAKEMGLGQQRRKRVPEPTAKSRKAKVTG